MSTVRRRLARSIDDTARSTKDDATPRLAFSRLEAAASLGVSLDFFDEHISHELRIVRRGRRKLIPVREIERWLAAEAARPLEGER